MKKLLLCTMVATSLLTSFSTFAQEDKSKRASPPATASVTTTNGNDITINYSQPAINGRTLGKEIAQTGKVWRTGANEATTLNISKDVMVEGKYPLAAGKYSIYSIPGDNSWTIIFNKKWDQWGTVYNESEDALRIQVKPKKAKSFTERMTFNINNDGMVNLMWGDKSVAFTLQ